jgi:signal transduction histidine kinase
MENGNLNTDTTEFSCKADSKFAGAFGPVDVVPLLVQPDDDLRLQIYKRLQMGFGAELTMPTAILQNDGLFIVGTPLRIFFCPYCKLIRSTIRGDERCKQCDYKHAKLVYNGKLTSGTPYRCWAGLWDSCALIRLKLSRRANFPNSTKPIAAIYCGQNRAEGDKLDILESHLREVQEVTGIPRESLISSYNRKDEKAFLAIQSDALALESHAKEISDVVSHFFNDELGMKYSDAFIEAEREIDSVPAQDEVAQIQEGDLSPLEQRISTALSAVCRVLDFDFGLVFTFPAAPGQDEDPKSAMIAVSASDSAKPLIGTTCSHQDALALLHMGNVVSLANPTDNNLVTKIREYSANTFTDETPCIVPCDLAAPDVPSKGLLIFVACGNNSARLSEFRASYIKDGLAPIIQTIVSSIEVAELFRDLKSAQLKFVTVARHQMITPLWIIEGAVKNLHGGYIPLDKRDVWFRAVVSTARMCKRILNSWHLLEQISLKSLSIGKLEFMPIRIYSFLVSLARDYYFRAHNFDVQIHVSEDIKQLPEPPCHEATLQHAVGNVLDNAIKYSDADTQVDVTCTNDEQWITIIVENQGIPLKMEDTLTIFNYGTRTPEAERSRAPDGTGVGLWLAKKIIMELHQGKIWAEPTDKRGFTRFYISLPLVRN